MSSIQFADGKRRCAWVSTHDDYMRYHDHEWGKPITNAAQLFERLCLEGFQAGLSWITILRKREAFREVFFGFDPYRVATMTEQDVERLLQDTRIVRHRGKILAVINNAQRYIEMEQNNEDLSALLWSFKPQAGPYGRATCPESEALSKALRKRGWKFVGPTTLYAMMQAVGMVNDHAPDCDFKHDR